MKAQLERIMELQPQWSHRKTPEMDERGQLVRHTGPEWLRTFSETLADALGIPHSDLLIEGMLSENEGQVSVVVGSRHI